MESDVKNIFLALLKKVRKPFFGISKISATNAIAKTTTGTAIKRRRNIMIIFTIIAQQGIINNTII
jgi:hypothetical protein